MCNFINNLISELLDFSVDILSAGTILKLTVFDPRSERPTPTPRRVSIPQPPPRTPTPEDETVKNDEPFDICIDRVENIPDKATIIRINGDMIYHETENQSWRVKAVPVLDSPSRSPNFDYKQQCNIQKAAVNIECVLFLRVYTVDADDFSLKVIGNAAIEPFNNDGFLKTGAHSLELHGGKPEGNPLDILNEPIVPATRILLRFTKHTQGAPAPPPSTARYKRHIGFNKSEINIIKSYSQEPRKTVRDSIIELQTKENTHLSSKTDSNLIVWLTNRLDREKLNMTNPAENLDVSKCINYRISTGLKVQITAAHGLPDSLNQVYGRVNRGEIAQDQPITDEGHGRNDQFVSMYYSINSHRKSPKWIDDPSIKHPHADVHSVILFQVMSLNVLYNPNVDHQTAGTVISLDGPSADITFKTIGWTIMPLFDENGVVSQGEYHLPLFQENPTREMQEALKSTKASDLLAKTIWSPESFLVSYSCLIIII